MEHLHDVFDSDTHFVIDSTNRSIITTSKKLALIQGDHNSERFTFEIDKIVEGHDMTKCDRVEVHYINIDNATRKQYSGVYEVNDLNVIDNKLTFTWLISGNATQAVGTLNFIVRFACTSNDDVVYAWHTSIFKNISILDSIHSADDVVMENADILAQWKTELFNAGYINASTMQNNIKALNARMDSFASLSEGSTTGDAELQDIRVGADGVTYDSAGTAIRQQINNLTFGRNLVTATNVTNGYYVFYETGWKEPSEKNSFATIPVISGRTYYISSRNNVHVALFNGKQAVSNYVTGYLNQQFVTIPDNVNLMTVSINTQYINDLKVYTKVNNDDIFDGVINESKLSSDLQITLNKASTYKKEVFVGVGGEYTSILEALIENQGNTRIFVNSGTYDIYSEYTNYYGSDYFEKYIGYRETTNRFDAGLYLFDGCELIGIGEVNLVFDYQGENENVKKFFSPINTTQNNVVKNVNVTIGKGCCRYIVHDDFASAGGTNVFKNCVFSGSSYFTTSMGCGMGIANTYLIENCCFLDNSGFSIAYHNNAANGSNVLFIKNCYCTGAIRGAHYGVSTQKSKMIVNGCKTTKVYLIHGDEATYPNKNIELFAWNNEVN